MRDARSRGLVAIVDRQCDTRRAIGIRCWQCLARSALGLGKRRREVGACAHHLARRSHLRPEQCVGAREAGKRQHGLLNADHAWPFLGDTEVNDTLAQGDPYRGIDQRHARRLRDKRHRAARTRVGLEDVDLTIADRILHVDEADDAERTRQLDRLSPHLCLDRRTNRERRNDARRIARVHPGLLHVLHDRADQNVATVGDCVDVDLDRVLDEAIYQGRRADMPIAQSCLVVTDPHRTTTEHVGRAHEDGIADPIGDLDRLLHAIGNRPIRRLETRLSKQLAKAQTILGEVDALERRAQDRHALLQESLGETQRRLAAELHDDANRLLARDHLEHILDREWLEVEPI